MMLFHITARSKDGMYFADADSIIIDPEVMSRVSGDWLYKIRLKGE